MPYLPKRTRGQKIGSQGHRWVMAEIERHSDWLARSLDEDFGVDAEAEFIPGEAKGDIIKLQFKSKEQVTIRRGKVHLKIDGKYLEYAKNCRYPVVFIQVDLLRKQAWYLWLQKWIFENPHAIGSKHGRRSVTIWVDASQTLEAGLHNDLQAVAEWRGPTQLALSLLDAFHAAMAVNNSDVLDALKELLNTVAPELPDTVLNKVIKDAIQLKDRLWGTMDGNTLAHQMFDLVRRFGNRMNLQSVDTMVRRGDSYSRTGLNALAFLYDEHFEHAVKLNLPEHFIRKHLAKVAYYCALREANPEQKIFVSGPGTFQYGGFRFLVEIGDDFINKYTNRGDSAILDYLVPVK